MQGAPRVLHLRVALPPSEENAPAQRIYLAPSEVRQEGPARVMLGRYGAAQSSIPAPSEMNYLAVRLKADERWRYTPPAGHDVAWLAVNAGRLEVQEIFAAGELVIFAESNQAIDVVAEEESSFVLDVGGWLATLPFGSLAATNFIKI